MSESKATRFGRETSDNPLLDSGEGVDANLGRAGGRHGRCAPTCHLIPDDGLAEPASQRMVPCMPEVLPQALPASPGGLDTRIRHW